MSQRVNPISGVFIGQSLTPEERRNLLEDLFVFGKSNQKPYLIRMGVLLVLSTVIAGSGLLSDSAAVVIGAMLVAPMMRPVMASAAAITLSWSSRFYQALLLVSVMAIFCVCISAILGVISPELVDIPDQILARTRPTFFDLVIALASGATGAYTMTRKESSAIPGVAMAVALLPPLSSCGILLTLGEYNFALKAFILFFTNYVAMVLAGCLTFMAVGVAPKSDDGLSRFKRFNLLVFTMLAFSICVPLYFYSHEVWYTAMYHANRSEELQEWLSNNQLLLKNIDIDRKNQILYLNLEGPQPPLNIDILYDEVRRYREKNTGKTGPISIEIKWTQAATLSWPPSESDREDTRKLKLDYQEALLNETWQWVGTQYADGDWLKPKSNAYTLQFFEGNKIDFATICEKSQGEYILQQEEVNFTIPIVHDKPCVDTKVDERYLFDINHAIHLDIHNQQLALRLNNNTGVMYFKVK